MRRLRDITPRERDDLARALRILVDESIGDMVYQIRDRELQGWQGPRVKAFGWACQIATKWAADPDPEEVKLLEALHRRREQLHAERKRIDDELNEIGGAP